MRGLLEYIFQDFLGGDPLLSYPEPTFFPNPAKSFFSAFFLESEKEKRFFHSHAHQLHEYDQLYCFRGQGVEVFFCFVVSAMLPNHIMYGNGAYEPFACLFVQEKDPVQAAHVNKLFFLNEWVIFK